VPFQISQLRNLGPGHSDTAYCVLSDTPNLLAMTVVAPGVRFSALAIFLTPAFCFASVLSVFRSSFDQERRTVFFAFLATRRSFNR